MPHGRQTSNLVCHTLVSSFALAYTNKCIHRSSSPSIVGAPLGRRADVGFRDNDDYDHELHVSLPLHDLPRIPIAPLPSDVLAGAVAGSAEITGAAKGYSRQIEIVRGRLANFRDVRRVFHFNDHFEDITEILDKQNLSFLQRLEIEKIEFALEPFTNLLMEKIASPLMNCSLDRLRCPRWNWYTRIPETGYFSTPHSDFGILFGSEVRFNNVFGGTLDDWFNFWTLLSDSHEDAPLILLDPNSSSSLSQRSAKRNVWPQKGELQDMRGAIYEGMKRGDSIVWRSSRVPHVSANKSKPTWRSRMSFDMRCVCTVIPRIEEETMSHQKCRQVWVYNETVQHGCSNPNGNPGRHWCVTESLQGGVGPFCEVERNRTSTRLRSTDRQYTPTKTIPNCTQRWDHCHPSVEAHRRVVAQRSLSKVHWRSLYGEYSETCAANLSYAIMDDNDYEDDEEDEEDTDDDDDDDEEDEEDDEDQEHEEDVEDEEDENDENDKCESEKNGTTCNACHQIAVVLAMGIALSVFSHRLT